MPHRNCSPMLHFSQHGTSSKRGMTRRCQLRENREEGPSMFTRRGRGLEGKVKLDEEFLLAAVDLCKLLEKEPFLPPFFLGDSLSSKY